MPRSDDLPDYRQPPIDEVAVGLQFDAIEGFSDVHTGLFWQQVRSQYPKTQSRPRVDVPIHDLNRPRVVPPPPLSFQLGPSPESQSGRTLLISDDDAYLLQVQDSQFMQNWRHRGAEYPHLDDLIERFWRAYDQFKVLLQEESLGQPRPRQLELTYFNWIPERPVGAFFVPAAASTLSAKSLSATPDDLLFVANFLDHRSGKPIARLQVECQEAFRVADEVGGQYGTRLVLSYKAPLSKGADRSVIDEMLIRGREVIVRTFTDLTTSEAHQAWERYK